MLSCSRAVCCGLRLVIARVGEWAKGHLRHSHDIRTANAKPAGTRIMAKGIFKWLIITNVIIACGALAHAQNIDAGKVEFQSSCAACHGADGKGKGPLSGVLKLAPPDLTALAKKNNGVFPVNAVYEMIDGRKAVEAHGTREMPIWGFRYMPSPYQAVNPSPATEAAIRARMLTIVDYLNRIQEK